ncbi:hypothetical protein ZIOFF_061336 [Zingiber officinale]|uniref:ER lumen protein-retaining receptor n=1 Tax=Zingiber officinale TaxID=94328 RepID=A0A8J5F760_ZINOF|nr:hypothetical protein ZIOFF_061336 [Zingiber officinale]
MADSFSKLKTISDLEGYLDSSNYLSMEFTISHSSDFSFWYPVEERQVGREIEIDELADPAAAHHGALAPAGNVPFRKVNPIVDGLNPEDSEKDEECECAQNVDERRDAKILDSRHEPDDPEKPLRNPSRRRKRASWLCDGEASESPDPCTGSERSLRLARLGHSRGIGGEAQITSVAVFIREWWSSWLEVQSLERERERDECVQVSGGYDPSLQHHIAPSQDPDHEILCRYDIYTSHLAYKNCNGISLKTQELYVIIFIARYLDLFTKYYSLYNSMMKVVFLGTSICIVWYMRYHKVVRQTYNKNEDTFQHFFLLVPCFVLALLIHHSFTIIEVIPSIGSCFCYVTDCRALSMFFLIDRFSAIVHNLLLDVLLYTKVSIIPRSHLLASDVSDRARTASVGLRGKKEAHERESVDGSELGHEFPSWPKTRMRKGSDSVRKTMAGRILWTFSIYLEAVAILPQLVLLQRSRNIDNLTGNYVFFLGAYRALYLLNWMYRFFTENHQFRWIPWLSGLVQTALYADFFYYYIMSLLFCNQQLEESRKIQASCLTDKGCASDSALRKLFLAHFWIVIAVPSSTNSSTTNHKCLLLSRISSFDELDDCFVGQ